MKYAKFAKVYYIRFLAQIKTESFFEEKARFCFSKKATNGSFFLGLQKQLETKKLGEYSWISF
jgi:hypothetical protein